MSKPHNVLKQQSSSPTKKKGDPLHERKQYIINEYERLTRITPAELEAEQLAKLQALVLHHYTHNAIYRNMLEARDVTPSDIKTLADIKKLPIITTKDILHHGFDFFTQPEKNATFLYTSGSTGQSKILPIHDDEKHRVFSNVALANYILGIRGDGINYCAFPCGPWPSSFYSQNGAELMNPTVRGDMRMPIEWHATALQKFKPAAIMASPAFISYLAAQISTSYDPKSLGVQTIKLCGEPFGEAFRAKVEQIFGADVRDLYGCAELGPASAECSAGKGKYHHLLAHEIIFEARRPGTENDMLPHDQSGELIATALFKTSLPLIRYNMKDIAALNDPKKTNCPCGLKLPTMSRILGRTDDMMTYGGANVYADMFYSVLDNLNISDKFQVIMRKDTNGMRDQMLIKIEYTETTSAETFAREIEKGLRKKSAELEYVFSNKLVNPLIVEIHPFGSLYKATAKLKRFIDERNT